MHIRKYPGRRNCQSQAGKSYSPPTRHARLRAYTPQGCGHAVTHANCQSRYKQPTKERRLTHKKQQKTPPGNCPHTGHARHKAAAAWPRQKPTTRVSVRRHSKQTLKLGTQSHKQAEAYATWRRVPTARRCAVPLGGNPHGRQTMEWLHVFLLTKNTDQNEETITVHHAGHSKHLRKRMGF